MVETANTEREENVAPDFAPARALSFLDVSPARGITGAMASSSWFNPISALTQWVRGLRNGFADYSPEKSLSNVPGIDPRLVPRGVMSSANIDTNFLNEIGKLGLKRGKLITAESHPELTQVWQQLSARAGFKKAPQLVLADSHIPNALSISSAPENVVVTTELFKALNLREVTAVLAHEIGHKRGDDQQTQRTTTLGLGATGVVLGNRFAHRGGVIGLFQRYLEKPEWLKNGITKHFGAEPKPRSVLAALATMYIGWDIGSLAGSQLTVPTREYNADKQGAILSGDPEGLISALRKLDTYSPKMTLSTYYRQLHGGYPSMESRIRALEAMPKQAVPLVETIPQNTPNPQVTGVAMDDRLVNAEMPSIAIH